MNLEALPSLPLIVSIMVSLALSAALHVTRMRVKGVCVENEQMKALVAQIAPTLSAARDGRTYVLAAHGCDVALTVPLPKGIGLSWLVGLQATRTGDEWAIEWSVKPGWTPELADLQSPGANWALAKTVPNDLMHSAHS